MKVEMTLDARRFQNALQEYQRATRKDEATIINRAAKNVAFRAIKFTPSADKEKIKSSITSNNLGFKILAKRKGKPGFTQKEMKKNARAFLRARMRSAGYIKAGWFKVVEAFGGRGGRVNPRSKIAQSYAIKAQAGVFPVAQLINKARGAYDVGLRPLQAAIDFVSKDMMAYAQKKLQETAKRYSAR